MSSQSIWTITVCKIKGIAYSAHMSLLLVVIWLGYDAYQRSHSVPLAASHSIVVLLLVVAYEGLRLFLLTRSPLPLKSITLYPFGGLTNSDRSLTLEHAQSDAARRRAVRLSCVPPVSLALIAVAIYCIQRVVPDNNLLELTFFAASLFAILLLLPVTPYPGGRLFTLFCQTHPRIPSAAVPLIKFLSLAGVGFLASWSNSVSAIIVVVVYVGIALEQHVFERSRAVAKNYFARDAMIPLHLLISLPHTTPCAEALEKSLRSFQTIFPVTHMEEVIGYVEKNALMQVAEEDTGPLISEVMTKTVSHVSPETPLSLVISIFRESHAPALFVFSEENQTMGLLVKEKVYEYLVVQSVQASISEQDDDSDED